MATIKPANIYIQLRKEEASLLIMAFKSGVINLGAFRATLEQCFMQRDQKAQDNHAEMMQKLFKLEDELLRQVLKETAKEAPVEEEAPAPAESVQVKPD